MQPVVHFMKERVAPPPSAEKLIRAVQVFAALFCLSGGSHAQALRDIAVNPLTGEVWAVGDRGTVLRSGDGGETWRAIKLDSPLHAHAVSFDGPSLALIGGRGVPGFPTPTGRAVILRSDDGRTFSPLPSGGLGWLYGGRVQAGSALVAGACLGTRDGGAWRTRDAGRTWEPLGFDSPGYLRTVAMESFRFVCLAGAEGRILSLRNFRQPARHPAERAGGLAFAGLAIGPDRRGWSVGTRGQVRTGGPADERWVGRPMPLPPGSARSADLQAVAVRKRCVAIAGGLTGLIFLSDDAGATFRPLSAPGSGPVRSLCWVDDDILLAGGDGGRIWRSADAGATWAQTHGPSSCDVLFLAAAGDLSLYPALLAHSRAGLDTAMVFATAPHLPETYPAIPPDQPARSAALTAGAGGVVVLDDFRSVSGDAADLNAEAILAGWSRDLDADAENELLRQLAFAIRVYRPAVVAVGFSGQGGRGRTAENRLIARLGRQAVELAADPARLPATEALPVWKVRRVFTGLEQNETARLPWESPRLLNRADYSTAIDASRIPRGDSRTIELQSATAGWLARPGPVTARPAVFTAFRCADVDGFLELMTSGLLPRTLVYEKRISTPQRMMAAGTYLQLGERGGNVAVVIPKLLDAAKEKLPPSPVAGLDNRLDPAVLAADRLLLAWTRLSEQGDLVRATQARDAFFDIGAGHPLFEQTSVVALAMGCSVEYRAALARSGPRQTFDHKAITRAAEQFADFHPWSDSAAGMLLKARALQVAGKGKLASATLAILESGPFPEAYRRSARLALLRTGKTGGLAGFAPLDAPFVPELGKIDGRLDETFWNRGRPMPLRPLAGEEPTDDLAGVVRLVRGPDDLRVGLVLPDLTEVHWRAVFAIDADHDGWTDFRLGFDSRGKRSAGVHTRMGPTANLSAKKNFRIQGRRDEDRRELTFELSIPLRIVGTSPGEQAWRVQLRVSAEDSHGRRSDLFLHPQSRPGLEPQRYGLLRLAPIAPTQP
jgi:photosystem II stability/assembly factor-like uncharacterized protein